MTINQFAMICIKARNAFELGILEPIAYHVAVDHLESLASAEDTDYARCERIFSAQGLSY